MPRFAPVAPPPLRPPLISLVTSARDALANGDETDGRWMEGFEFRPEANKDPVIRDWCTSDGSNDDVPSEQPAGDLVQTVPWMVEVEDDCTVLGFRGTDYVGRAERALAAATPKGVEREFWTGTVAQAAGWPNRYLADNSNAVDVTPTPGTAVVLPEAVELLEDALAMCGAGGRGMIHCAAWSTPSYSLVRNEGGLLLMPRGTIVVPGDGYLGTGPDGTDPSSSGETWLYATGVVDLRLGPIEVFGQQGASRQGDAGQWFDPASSGFDPERFAPVLVDRTVNKLAVRARRMVAATWDGACLFAVLAALNPEDT
jgi:hypothetical protein